MSWSLVLLPHHFLLGFSSISKIPFSFSLNKFSSLCCCYYSASASIGLSSQNKILQKIPVTLSKELFGLKVQLEGRKGWKGTAVQRGGILVFISHSKAAGEVPGQTLIEKGKKSTTYYLIPGQETAF